MMKWVIRGIAVIAAVNLILLIFFSDRLFPEQKTEETTPAAKTVITISFDDDTVRYDGNGLFSVMNGVRAVDENGKDLTDHLTASIQPAAEAEDPMHSRVIYYAVRLRDGSYAEAERTLLLENYLLPSITFHGVGDVIPVKDLSTAVQMLSEGGFLSAEDGFGHDITGAVTMVCDTEIRGSGTYTFTLSAENMLGDAAVLHTSLSVDAGANGDAVVLRLTDRMLVLPRGTRFRAEDYIAEAYSTVSGDLTALVEVEGSVDSAAAGTYLLTYRLRDPAGGEAEDVTLTVTIVD